jgi:membrane protein implicated in regulation of membrane protease activity
MRDLIGDDAYVSVAIPAGRYGSVLVKKEGQTHEFSATASIDIPSGTVARVSGVAGNGLIVQAIPASNTSSGGDPEQGGTQGA